MKSLSEALRDSLPRTAQELTIWALEHNQLEFSFMHITLNAVDQQRAHHDKITMVRATIDSWINFVKTHFPSSYREEYSQHQGGSICISYKYVANVLVKIA